MGETFYLGGFNFVIDGVFEPEVRRGSEYESLGGSHYARPDLRVCLLRLLMAACWLAVSFCATYNGSGDGSQLYYGVRFILWMLFICLMSLQYSQSNPNEPMSMMVLDQCLF